MSLFPAIMLATLSVAAGPVTFVGAALLGGGSSFSSSAVSGCQSGDFAMIWLADDQSTNCDVTTGWTAVLDLLDGYSETSAYIGFWVKKLTSSDCSASISNTTSSTSGILAVYRGVDADTFLAAATNYYNSIGKNTTSVPSSSTFTNGTFTTDDYSVIVGMAQDSTNSLTGPGGGWSAPTNGTESGGSGSTSSRILINHRTGATGTLSPGSFSGQSSGNFLTNLHIRLPSL